jgi:uncharacterized protein (DUF924 family)
LASWLEEVSRRIGTKRKEIVVSSPEEVLSYWFPEKDIFNADRETLGRQMQWWFQGGPEVDTQISERFGQVLEQARRGELDHWAQTPRGRLALIVVLDQFSRNIYRGSPLSYAQDPKALELAVGGIDASMDRKLSPMERTFFWMPLGHSEVPTLQERIVHHPEEEAANAPPQRRAMAEFGISQARAVRDVIACFGRHPHRNEILGRTSTPEELEYLRTETPPHMRRAPS